MLGLACASLAWLCGCVANVAPPRVWATDDMVHLTDRTPASAAGDAWEPSTATVELFSAANETVSFQLIIDAAEGLPGVRISAGKRRITHSSWCPVPRWRAIRCL